MPRTQVAMHPESRQAAVILGSLIRRARKGQGFTVEEAAELIGVSPKTLTRIEYGTGTSTLAHVFNAATVFGIQLFESDASSLSSVYDQMRAEGLLPSERPSRFKRNP